MRRAPESWPNGYYMLDEVDITLRDSIVGIFTSRLTQGFRELNKAIRFLRIETPCITPTKLLQSHIEANFELVKVGENYLRPESTIGTYEAFKELWPIEKERKAQLPICLWQVSHSFRDEPTRMSELRFKEFEQLEYQLFYAEGTKADYHGTAVNIVKSLLNGLDLNASERPAEPLPHYSSKTTDVYGSGINRERQHELVATSTRKDFECPVLEVSAGLTRILALWREKLDGKEDALAGTHS